MKRGFIFSLIICVCLWASIVWNTIVYAWSMIIYVPDDYATIQAGIDAAISGDIVVVADGIYTGEGNKNLDFKGKAITVTSENGAEYCIIDCENEGIGFYFHSGETEASAVNGFTIRKSNILDDDQNGGGIICMNNSSPTITNNTIYGSRGDILVGGGIVCSSSSPTIANNTIHDNSVDSGGGIYCLSSSPTITNNIIYGNVARLGGGILCEGSPSPTITNNIIYNNWAILGGGIFCSSSSPTIANNTIYGNWIHPQGIIGGGIYCENSSSPAVTNTILWNNSPEEIYLDDSTITVTYSDVKDGWPGEGNIDADPSFVDPDNGDYHLNDNSPCIGAGTSEGATDYDIEGNPRGTPPDIGAYENARDIPLAVTLASLTALSDTDSITIKWRTATENQNLGFNIYRGDTQNGNYIKINARLIAGADSDVEPNDYSFTDDNIKFGHTYYYYIEDIDFAGKKGKSPILQITVGQKSAVTVIDKTDSAINARLKPVVMPTEFALLPNFPNPFNPETWIPYQLSSTAQVVIKIYNVQGRLIRTLDLGRKNAGYYRIKERAGYWDGRDAKGERVASGMYFYTLKAGDFIATRKLAIVK